MIIWLVNDEIEYYTVVHVFLDGGLMHGINRSQFISTTSNRVLAMNWKFGDHIKPGLKIIVALLCKYNMREALWGWGLAWAINIEMPN